MASDAQRYETLKRAVAEIGLIRRGTLLHRLMPCGKSGCRCQADPPRLHGPYYQWTRKVNGKTVTVRVQPEDAGLVAEWIDNGRKLNRIVGDLERVSDRLTERALRAARKTRDATAVGDRTRRVAKHATRRPKRSGRPK